MRYQYGSDSRHEQLRLVRGVLEGGSLGRLDGTLVAAFEDGVAAYTRSCHAIAVASGTAAIELALAGVGVGRGDEVVVPEFGWASVGGAVAALGATVVVAPSGPWLAPTWDDIQPLLTSATRAVVVAHMRGVPALDVRTIAAGLRARGIPLVEDCSQAWGVHLEGRHVGSLGDAATLSTQQSKLVATGEGGFVLTDDDEVALAVVRASGNALDSTDLAQWVGNSRMTELQAAVGIPQLDGLEELIGRLRSLQAEMLALLATFPDVEETVPVEAALARRGGRSNGTWAGLWARDVASARRVAQRLWAAGVRATVGGAPDDRHWSASWPVRVADPRLDSRRWVELSVPDATPDEHDAVLGPLAAATAGSRLRPTSHHRAAPSLAVAIVGCGEASRQYAPTLMAAGIRVVACVDSDAGRAAELAGQCGGAPRTVDEVVADNEVGLVVNLTPPVLHAPLTRTFLEAGKGVYSEKPLAVSGAEAAALVELATNRGVPLACAPETALDPRWDALVRLIRAGLIGKPTGARVDLVSSPAAWHPRPAPFYGPGGGPLWNLGPYGVTALTLLFGPISAVTGRAPSGSAGPQPVPTEVSALLDFQSGLAATMEVSYDRPMSFGPALGVFGADGVARFSGSGLDHEGELQVCRRDGGVWTTIPVESQPIRGRGVGVIDFVEAMSRGRVPTVDVGVALHVVEVIEAIEKSCVRAESVVVDSRAHLQCGLAT